jgi:hypothetical protein
MRGGRLSMVWTAKERDFIERNRGKMPMSEMARCLGRTHVAVLRAMQRLVALRRSQGVRMAPLKGKVDKLVRERGDRIRELNSEGYSDLEIAKMLRVDKRRVWRARRALGLPSNNFNARHRRKLGEHSRQIQGRRVWSMLSAERLGWPMCTLAEARVLEALRAVGQCSRADVARFVGVSLNRASQVLAELGRRGLAVRIGREHRLADGVEPGAGEEE